MKQESVASLATVANAAQLTVAVLERLNGPEMTKSIAGTPLSQEMLFQQVQSSLEKQIEQKTN